MKYLVRALKYLIYFVALFFVIVGIIWLITPKPEGGLHFNEMFQAGSMPKLIIFFIAVSAVYPALGFTKRKLYINGDYAKYREEIVKAFDLAGYAIETEDDKQVSFRLTSKGMRFSRLYEDRITVDITETPLVLSGYRRDVDKMLRNASYQISLKDQEDEETAA